MGHSTYVTDKRRQCGKGLANVLVGTASKWERKQRRRQLPGAQDRKDRDNAMVHDGLIPAMAG